MTSARHSKATPRWGTPPDIVERARRAMGNIDLDPCSEPCFEGTVKAVRSYSLERDEDGLKLPWVGNILCNPPSGLVREFWLKAMVSAVPLGSDRVVWIGFSIEQLALLADLHRHPLDFSTCILRKRLSFVRHDGFVGSPSHANYITGIRVPRGAFEREFGELGKIVHGKDAI